MAATRPVTVFEKTYFKGENLSPPEVNGKYIPVEIGKGVFHQWGCESDDRVEYGTANDTVAIVEMPDGTVKTPYAYNIRFDDVEEK